MKTREKGNSVCYPVRVKLRRIGNATEEMICGVWIPTAAFGASWIYSWVESVLVAGQGFKKPERSWDKAVMWTFGRFFFSTNSTVGG